MDYTRVAVCLEETSKTLMKELNKYNILENNYKNAQGIEKEGYRLLMQSLKEKISLLLITYHSHLETMCVMFN